jgi:hypothetical protein
MLHLLRLIPRPACPRVVFEHKAAKGGGACPGASPLSNPALMVGILRRLYAGYRKVEASSIFLPGPPALCPQSLPAPVSPSQNVQRHRDTEPEATETTSDRCDFVEEQSIDQALPQP